MTGTYPTNFAAVTTSAPVSFVSGTPQDGPVFRWHAQLSPTPPGTNPNSGPSSLGGLQWQLLVH